MRLQSVSSARMFVSRNLLVFSEGVCAVLRKSICISYHKKALGNPRSAFSEMLGNDRLDRAR